MGDDLPEQLYTKWRSEQPDSTLHPAWDNVDAETRRTWEAVAVVARGDAATKRDDQVSMLRDANAAWQRECAELREQADAANRIVRDDHNDMKALRLKLAERNAQLDATRNAIGAECVEHVELNGHIDLAEQCRDYLGHEAIVDTGGKLADFLASLRIVIDQCDRQRRRANWYEAAYTAGKQKLIESAVERALSRARAAAQVYAERVEALGLAADDNDPLVMATAGPLGEAQADLYATLGLFNRSASRDLGVVQAVESVEQLRAERDTARMLAEVRGREVARLDALINTPRTDEFFEAVRIEAAHQVNRWGVEHDAGKRPEDWITLFTYLLGKAATAHFAGDRAKLEHHIITVAAVALNWHRAMTGASTAMRPGVAP